MVLPGLDPRYQTSYKHKTIANLIIIKIDTPDKSFIWNNTLHKSKDSLRPLVQNVNKLKNLVAESNSDQTLATHLKG